MIQITLADGQNKVFKNYHDVCSHLNHIERPKTTLESGKTRWSFMRRRHETLYSLYYRTPSLKGFLTPKEKEAVEKELSLIEIMKGNWENVTQILYTAHLDIEPLKRDWCKEYCQEHGLKISELVINN